MNDLDLVRTIRATVPAPAPARLAAGRGRLLAAAARPRRLSRPGHPWRLVLPAGAVTAAAAVASVAVLGGTATPSRPRPAPAAPTARADLAAQVLAVAARTVAAEPSARPRDHQWFYSRFVQTQTGQPTQSDENWVRFDGLEQAYYQDGQLIIHHEPSGSGGPLDSYEALAALPAGPAAILAAAGQVVGTTPRSWENWSAGSIVAELAPRTQGQAEFDYLAQLVWNATAAAPPAALAHVYQAMAELPGVTVAHGLADAVGRTGLGVSANGGVSWLLLDPRTYQVIGLNEKAVSPRPAQDGPGPVTFAGTISMAWADVASVGGPGKR